MKSAMFALFIFAATTAASAQQGLARLKKGNELYAQQKYEAAITEYEALVNSSTRSVLMITDARINLADCYRQVGRPTEAVRMYRDVLPESADRPEILLQFGEVLMGIGRFDEAKEQLLAYAKVRPDDPRGAKLAEKCDQIQAIRPLYTSVKIDATAVNDSTYDDFGMAYYGNGVVFASDRIVPGTTDEWKDRSFLNMYYSEILPDGGLGPARIFSKRLNSLTRHDGPATFTRDAQMIVYSQSAKPSKDAASDALVLQLVSAMNDNGKWSKTEALPFVIPDMIFSSPCLSADGTLLFFMSNMKGGYGGTDIWVSTYKYGRWSNPRNLGPNINTAENEAAPFLHPDGTLFFSSKGHAGYGGYDLFRAKPEGNGTDWQKGENIGQPFNSAFDDTYFVLSDDQTKGFFSSARFGSDDIFRFILEGETPKTLPEGIKARSSAIFSDSTDLDAFVIEETPDDGSGKKTDKEAEAFVDKMLKDGYKPTDGNKTAGTTGNKNNNTNNPDKQGGKDGGNNGGTDSNDNNDGNTAMNDGGNKDGGNGSNDGGNNDGGNNGGNDSNDGGNNDGGNNDNTTADNGNGKPTRNGGKGSKTNKGGQIDPNVVLTVALQVVDSRKNAALTGAKVVLRDLLNGDSKEFSVQADGSVELLLAPERDYEAQATCAGYYSGRLPIATKGVRESQNAKAVLPLIKKEDAN